MKRNGEPVRIDFELSELLREIADKNEISLREASKNLAKLFKNKLKGTTIPREIKF